MVRDYRLLLAVGIVFIGAGGSAISMVFSFSRAALPVPDRQERVFASATLRTILSAAWVFGPSVGALVSPAPVSTGSSCSPRRASRPARRSCGACASRKAISAITRSGHGPEPSSSITVPPLTEPGEDAHEDLPGVASANDIGRAVAALTLLGLAANATMIVLPLYIVHG